MLLKSNKLNSMFKSLVALPRYLSEDGIVQCTQNGKADVNSLIKVALDSDLREIGQGWLPEEVNRGKADYVEGPGVLQLQKIRNVSAPKDNEESQAAPRLMKLVLTDGHINCTAIETEVIKDIGLNTAPGSKIKLRVTTDVEHGFLLLNNKNTQLLGGRVDKLAEGWELKKKLAKQQRATFGEGGPPPFVPFGKRIESNHFRNPSKRDNFKSLDSNKAEKKGDDDEFEQQRKATIAEAVQAKEDGSSKRFGGGQKQVNSDRDIARITEMGFRPDEASSALKASNGDVQQAIESLLSRRGGPAGRGGTSRQSSYESRDGDRGVGRGRRDRKEDDEGPGRVRKGRDNDFKSEEPASRPSGPATLFDFLETKMPAKESKDSKKERDNKIEQDQTSQSGTSDKPKSQDRDRPRTSAQNQSDSWSQNQSNRRPQQQQNIPPRFVNKKQEDQSYRQGRRDDKPRDDRVRSAPNDYRNTDRSYGDRNYTDRSYNDRNYNRNYNDRGYSDRSYNDRGYNDRNYNDRSYNDRSYNERNFSDRNYYDKGYNDRNNSGREERKEVRRDDRRDDRRDNYRRDDRGGRDTQNSRDSRQNYDRNSDNYQKNSYSSKPSASNTKSEPPRDGRSNQGRDAERPRQSQNYQQSRNVSQQNNNSHQPPQTYNQPEGQSSSRNNQGNTNRQEKYQSKNLNKDTQNYETENSRSQSYDSNNSNQTYNNTTSSQAYSDTSSSQTYSNNTSGQNYNTSTQIYNQDSYSQGSNINTNSYVPTNPPNFQTNTSIETYGANGMYVNPQMSMEIQMSTGPPQYTQPPNELIYTASQVPISFKPGDRVMAKYWEDGLFYESVIEMMMPNTCVVNFVEYGNSEEVLLSDIRPMIPTMMGQPSPMAVPQPDLTVPPPQVFYSAPPPQMSPIDDLTNAISSMEFRRGGSGPMYPRKQDNRPQQPLYQAPVQRR